MVMLEPMSEEFFQDYLHGTLTVYAEAHVRAGNWAVSESTQKAEEQIQRAAFLGKIHKGTRTLGIRYFQGFTSGHFIQQKR